MASSDDVPNLLLRRPTPLIPSAEMWKSIPPCIGPHEPRDTGLPPHIDKNHPNHKKAVEINDQITARNSRSRQVEEVCFILNVQDPRNFIGTGKRHMRLCTYATNIISELRLDTATTALFLSGAEEIRLDGYSLPRKIQEANVMLRAWANSPNARVEILYDITDLRMAVIPLGANPRPLPRRIPESQRRLTRLSQKIGAIMGDPKKWKLHLEGKLELDPELRELTEEGRRRWPKG